MAGKAATGTAALALLRALGSGEAQSIGDLASGLGRTHRQVAKAAAQLARRKWITRERGGAGIYQATTAGLDALAKGATVTSGPVGPNGKIKTPSATLRARAWLAMRVRRVFSVGEIVSDASITGEGTLQDRENVARYIARLKDAGYIAEGTHRRPGTALTSNGFKQFALRRNTGMKPPVYRAKNHEIHDPNTGEDVPCAPR